MLEVPEGEEKAQRSPLRGPSRLTSWPHDIITWWDTPRVSKSR
jgi:hypothetical protein